MIKKEREALFEEIRKRDKIIDDLRKQNEILLRTALKNAERKHKEVELKQDKIHK